MSLVFDTQGIVGPTGHLYAGGSFIFPENRVARWDGSNWTGLGSGIGNNSVLSLVFDTQGIVGPTGALYAGGNFTSPENRLARWDGGGWTGLGSGIGNNQISSLVFDIQGIVGPTGALYASGDFTIQNAVAIIINGIFYNSNTSLFSFSSLSNQIGRTQYLCWSDSIYGWQIMNNTTNFSFI